MLFPMLKILNPKNQSNDKYNMIQVFQLIEERILIH